MSEAQTTETVAKRPRGGTKGKGTRKPRPDRSEAMSVKTDPGDNTRLIEQTMKIMELGRVDKKDPEQVKARISEYLSICSQSDMKPSVAGLALAFGVHRTTLWGWANSRGTKDMPEESCNLVKVAYLALNALVESYAQEGKMNPTMAVFLLSNHFGYRDVKAVDLNVGNDEGEKQASPEELQAKYLETVDVDCEVVDE